MASSSAASATELLPLQPRRCLRVELPGFQTARSHTGPVFHRRTVAGQLLHGGLGLPLADPVLIVALVEHLQDPSCIASSRAPCCSAWAPLGRVRRILEV